MKKSEEVKREWKAIFDPNKPAALVFRSLCKWVYKLRSILLAIPVIVAAIVLAMRNLVLLPGEVGFTMTETGAFAQTVGKMVAVMGPLAITAVCLLLMFCSKRVLYPWLISVFSLVLPVVILLVNTFPG